MLPAFYLCDGAPEPLMTICVDQTEFVVNKLKDRGTHQAYGVVTNAQDFMHVLRFYVEQWEQRDMTLPVTAAAGWAAARRLRRSRSRCRRPRWTASGCSAPMRREGREWGTAVLSRVDGDRRRIYTARYVLADQGQGARASSRPRSRKSGAARWTRSASCSRSAQRRIDDEHPPLAGAARALVRPVAVRADGQPR